MPELNALSRIGFGCYRISRKAKEHYHALRYALSSGCNLIDTAANYENGESERLIGEVLSDFPDQRPFIVTKAGYIQGESITLLEKLNRSGRAKEDLVRVSDDLLYSIHPDFLDAQLKLSCCRLRTSQLDGLLLHNPEYYFAQVGHATSQDEHYERIKKAFEFLEEISEQGRIRYYGISSNTFPFSTAEQKTTSLPHVLALAEAVSTNHHFKLVQFPFNLIENDAQKPHHNGLSLIDIARANGIVTLANRPLNANSSNGPVRLANYEEEVLRLDEQRGRQLLEQFLGLLRRRLDEIGSDDDIMEFVPIQVLSQGWTSFRSPDAVDQVFDQRLFPFLNKLYEECIDQEVLSSLAKLRQVAVLYAKRYMGQKAEALRVQMIEQGTITQGDDRPLPLVACQNYLDAGIDHVLVGMRSLSYVNSLRGLFRT
jgi:aryl-alcohol dehydrogenase-like predicted oxidoreductase